jgi:hypothetical protein
MRIGLPGACKQVTRKSGLPPDSEICANAGFRREGPADSCTAVQTNWFLPFVVMALLVATGRLLANDC